MNAPDTALQGQDRAVIGQLYMAFELGEKSWKLSLTDGVRAPSRYTVAPGYQDAVLRVIAKAKTRCGLAPQAPVRSCYGPVQALASQYTSGTIISFGTGCRT
nr:hypothetical protein [Cupriavidus lacunae]